MTKVVVGFVHPAASVAPQFRRCLTMVQVREAAIPSLRRIVGELDQESSANISTGRCRIVEQFLAHPAQPDWLWMVDADMTFPDDILDRLLSAADPKTKPIVGGLCFGVRPVQVDGVEHFSECLGTVLELFPTIFTLDDEGRLNHHFDYTQDSVIQAHSTGAACLLIHRSVVADPRWTADGHPLPWFRETVLHGKVCSEDHFFCLRAGAFGFPLHIATGARTGHVKTFVADEALYLSQRVTADA